jgi:hypothetical protein
VKLSKLSSALEEELSESSQLAQGPIPTGVPADKLQQLDTRTSTAELAQRQASLAVIQSGKYRQAQQPGELLPSEAFASSKADEKAWEERR